MQVLQFLTDKIAVLSAFLPVYMLCKTYVSIHKLCNLHKGEKSQKSSNFVRKFSGGKPADKADFLTFGNIFGAFCLTVKKVLRSPRDGGSVSLSNVPRQGFRFPPHCPPHPDRVSVSHRNLRFHFPSNAPVPFSAATPVSISRGTPPRAPRPISHFQAVRHTGLPPPGNPYFRQTLNPTTFLPPAGGKTERRR